MQRQHRQFRFSWLTAGVAAASLACGSGIAAAQAAPAAARHALPERVAGSVHRLFLINGDRLLVSTSGGRTQVAVRYAAKAGALASLHYAGQTMEIPDPAMPYLGRALSPSLFQLSALEKAESGGRLPVTVRFSGSVPALAGLTVTRAGAGTESGYLTASSAKSFGTALSALFRRDHARASYGTDGMLGGVSIALAGAAPASAAPAATRPDFPMRTLTVHALGLNGKPDNGDTVFIGNTDRTLRFVGLNETENFFYHGAAKFSLPAGHYWAIATYFTFNAAIPQLRMEVVPQFTVSGSHSTLHLDGRRASSEVTVATPLPSQAITEGVTFDRGAAHGTPYSYSQSWSGFTGWLSPTTRKPTIGSLNAYTQATLGSTGKASPPNVYNTDFPGPDGIIPAQHFTLSQGELATVHERYYQDTPSSSGGWSNFGGTRAQLVLQLVPITEFSLPATQTQYFQSGHGVIWESQIFENLSTFAGFQSGSFRSYGGGESMSENWNRYPLHPGPDGSFGGLAGAIEPTQISADRAGDTLNLALTPFSDNQFGHTGAGFGFLGYAKAVGSYQLDQDGTEIAHGTGLDGFPAVKLGARPALLKLTLNAARYGSFFHLSPVTRTVWAWHSTPSAGATVPPGWYCSLTVKNESVILHRTCAVQPLMTLHYSVQGMSLAGLTSPGGQTVDVTAGHIQLGGSAAIAGATAQVSYNDGGSWYPATLTARGGGRYRLAFSAPAGVDVSLRVSATDAAGGSITETITRAYGTTS
ncbi:MAG TPA: hypothetical protein VGG25_28905 [Streptosporangiaceae bacterium]